MYYPPNKIKPNLYTVGGEFTTQNKDYIGFYFSTFDGKYFTGKNIGDTNNIELKPINKNDIKQNTYLFVGDKEYFESVKPNIQQLSNKLIPQQYTPLPLESDYQKGYFDRYFIKKVNSNNIIEVNSVTFNDISQNIKYDSFLYKSIKIKWYLTGLRVSQTINNIVYPGLGNKNFSSIQEANLTFEGIDQIITDYFQFSRPS